jgi:hypothetical protein
MLTAKKEYLKSVRLKMKAYFLFIGSGHQNQNTRPRRLASLAKKVKKAMLK